MGKKEKLIDGLRSLLTQKSGEKPITEEEKAWNDFIRQTYGPDKLINLAKDPEIEDIYRLRAIELLLHPHPKTLDFDTGVYGNRKGMEYYEWIDRIEDRMLKIVVEYLIDFREIAEKDWRLVKPRGLDWDEEKSWQNCNRAIMIAAKTLGGEEGKRVFESFSIKNPKGLGDSHKGYRPLEWLINNPAIETEWKELALARLHEEIEQEDMRPEKGKNNHHPALDFLTYGVVDAQLKVYSRSLEDPILEKEIYYLADRETEVPLIDLELLPSIWRIIEGKALTRKLVRAATVDCKRDNLAFEVTSGETKRLAQEIMEMLEDDKEVVDYMREKILKYEDNRKKQCIAERDFNESNREIIRRMKKKGAN